ncbi:MAG: DUF4335 domain-containing protein [Cyanobacteria bacterium CRU_2_1]|nr:DUF4335 domain-containing protein [Cyanobacteria bacterium CRU_2_1]
MTIQPQASEQSLSVPPPTQIDLTTVQLFDLVEAVDQFFADAQTLPDLSLKLAPLPKRYVVPKEPASKRAVPVALGVSSLVATALGLFFIPAPRVELPERGRATTQESPTASPSPTASASPNNPDSTDAEASSNLGNLDAILENSTEIVDPVELEGLTAQLQGRLYDDWLEKPTPTFTEPLEYRVGVDENGEIVGYSFVNDPALNYLDEIPLSDVQLASETPSEPSGEESIAQFLVIFRPDGVLEVSPWYGLPSAPSNLESSPTPESEGQAIESSPSSEESTVESSP